MASLDLPEKVKVLIIDDEIAYVNVLKKRMSKRGIFVETAHSGREAIKKMRNNIYDVALLDLKMEDMDGIEVLKILKMIDPDMPIIMITGHGSEKAAKDGMHHGAYDYLMKPCDFDLLLEKISESLKGHDRSESNGSK